MCINFHVFSIHKYNTHTHTHAQTHKHTFALKLESVDTFSFVTWFFFHLGIYYWSVCNFQHLFCVFILWAISYTHIFLMDIELVFPISLFVYFNFIDNQKFTNEQWSESSKRELAFRSEIFVYYIPGKFVFSLNQ